jgi:hypothetical protein
MPSTCGPLTSPKASDIIGICCLNGLRSTTRASLGGISRLSVRINTSRVRALPLAHGAIDAAALVPLGNWGRCASHSCYAVYKVIGTEALGAAQNSRQGKLWAAFFVSTPNEDGTTGEVCDETCRVHARRGARAKPGNPGQGVGVEPIKGGPRTPGARKGSDTAEHRRHQWSKDLCGVVAATTQRRATRPRAGPWDAQPTFTCGYRPQAQTGQPLIHKMPYPEQDVQQYPRVI